MNSQFESIAELLLTPLLVVAFTCATIGSFVIWQLRVARAAPGEHTPFRLHLLHESDRHIPTAVIACLLGAVALLLPVTLVLRLTH